MVMNRLFILIFTLFFTTTVYGAAEKVSVRYAKGFSVEYQNELTLITVKNPWPGAKSGFKYLLKPRGSKTPPGFSDCQVVEVPVTKIVALSTTLLAFLEQLNLLDQLVGFNDLSRVHSERVKMAGKNNPILEVGQGSNLQVEIVLDLEPSIIFTYGTGSFRDVHPKLLEADLNVAIVGEYMESHPLGRSEWIKFLALFCGLGPESEQLFSDLEARYSHLAALAQTVQHRPTVITGVPFSGRWFVAGGNSFISQLSTMRAAIMYGVKHAIAGRCQWILNWSTNGESTPISGSIPGSGRPLIRQKKQTPDFFNFPPCKMADSLTITAESIRKGATTTGNRA